MRKRVLRLLGCLSHVVLSASSAAGFFAPSPTLNLGLAILGSTSLRNFRVTGSSQSELKSAVGGIDRRKIGGIDRRKIRASSFKTASPTMRLSSERKDELLSILHSSPFLQAMHSNDYSQLSSQQLLKVAACCVPELMWESAKGGAGRLAVVGGSLEYTGAPYFAAAAMLRGGADLCHVFCEHSAGTAIKSYSPELIVHPVLRSLPADQTDVDIVAQLVDKSSEDVGQWIPRLDGVLIGPGLGRDAAVIETCSRLIVTAAMHGKPLLLDADGLFILTSALAPRQGSATATHLELLATLKTAQLTITPNKVEWERLCKALNVLSSGQDALSDAHELAPQVARLIGNRTTVVVKGPKDVISDGTRTIVCDTRGSPRRAGGQGDVLAGLLLLFKEWASQTAAVAGGISELRIPGLPSLSGAGGEGMSLEVLTAANPLAGLLELACAYAACVVARRSAAAAYGHKQRSMLAGDVLDHLGPTFHSLFPPTEV